MAITKTKKPAHGSKKAIVFALLDENPDISTDAAIAELRRQKYQFGANPKNCFYSMKTLWRKERGHKLRSGKKRGNRGGSKPQRVEQVSDVDMEVELRLLQVENARLKGIVAILIA